MTPEDRSIAVMAFLKASEALQSAHAVRRDLLTLDKRMHALEALLEALRGHLKGEPK